MTDDERAAIPGATQWIREAADVVRRGRLVQAERLDIDRRRAKVAIRQHKRYAGPNAMLVVLGTIGVIDAPSRPTTCVQTTGADCNGATGATTCR